MWALISAAWAGCLVLSGGEYFDGDGFVAGDLVFVDGRIAAVGQKPAGLSGATYKGRECTVEELDATDRVTPGLIDVASRVGLSEVGLEAATVDDRGTESDPIRASLRVAEAYNPASVYVPIFRANGITSAVLMPGGGKVAGQAGWVRLAGATQSDAVVDPSVAVKADLSGDSKAEALQTLRELLEDARAFDQNSSAVESNRFRSFVDGASRHDLEALVPVAKGALPLVVSVDRASDIEAVVRLREVGARVVIEGGAEAWKLAEQLAEAKVPVILAPMVYGPGSFGQVHARPDNAQILAEAGVPIAIVSHHNYNAPALRYAAGNAVRGGLSQRDALRAVTTWPAAIFQMDDRGTLAKGQAADVVVWSGDPFEIGTRVELVVIDGERRSLENRHQALLERYRTLPGTPVPGLPLE